VRVDLDPDAPEVLNAEGCVRLDGDIVSGTVDDARVSFVFGSASSVGGVAPMITFAGTGGDSASVTSRGAVGNPFAVGIDAAPAEATAFTLVVGSRAAVLVVDGAIVGAVETDGRGAVTVEASNDGTRLEHLTRSAPLVASGCET
jgi:hypothetical protein